MPYAAFDEYNRTATEKAANPRNLTSGIMHSLDPHLAGQRGLVFVAYTLILPKARLDHRSQAWDIQSLQQMGFQTTMPGYEGLHMYTTCTEAILQKLDYLEGIRSQLPYPIDGVVIKVSDRTVANSFGSTDHHPLHSIAYKFPASTDHGTIQATRLRSIEFSLANSGRVTPVAIADAVQLYGTTVKRYDLSSYNLFQSQGPWHIGDTLTVTKAGETRPKILSNLHDGTGTLITFPKACPCCNTPLSIEGAYAFCRNPKCRHQLFTPEVQRQANADALMSDLFPPTAPSTPSSPSHSSSTTGSTTPSLGRVGKGSFIVVSGTVSSPSRKLQLKELVKKHAHLQSQVNGKTTHLLAGSGVGTTKLSEALRLGVQIITEQQFLSMLG